MQTEYIQTRSSKLPMLTALIMFGVGYIFSLWLVDAYYLGDAYFYSRFYEVLYQMPVEHWKSLQLAYISSSEPFYRYIIGFGSNLDIARTTYISFWNAVLVGGIGFALAKYRASPLFAALVFTNYYLLVLLGPAERLKFAYVALVLGFCFQSPKPKFALGAASIFFHNQALIQFSAAAAHFLASKRQMIFISPVRTISILGALAVLCGIIGYYLLQTSGEALASKVDIYSESSSGLSEAIQWGMLLIGGYLVFRDKMAYAAGMIPLGLFTALYGNRVNIATLAFFAAIAVAQRKTNNPLVLLVMAYMSYKSVNFIQSVLIFGQGYGL